MRYVCTDVTAYRHSTGGSLLLTLSYKQHKAYRGTDRCRNQSNVSWVMRWRRIESLLFAYLKEKTTKYTERCIWHINRAGFSLKTSAHQNFGCKKIVNRPASSRGARRSVTVVKILKKTWMCQRIFVRDIAQYKTTCQPIRHVRTFALFLAHAQRMEKICFAWIGKHQWARKIIGSRFLRQGRAVA
jgi:hypothetical protein